MTAAENMLWKKVRNGRICGYTVRRQQIINGFIADFYCHTARLVPEVDGDIHGAEAQGRYDVERKILFNSLGFLELSFTNEEMYKNISDVVGRIERTVSDRVDTLLFQEKGRG